MNKQTEALKLALDALEIGYEYAVETTEHFHIEMAGYKQHRHDAMDAEVKKISDAITAIREALADSALERMAENAKELGLDYEAAQQQEVKELTAQRDKLSDILTRTANALKGQPEELAAHSWHDLPEVAQQLKAAQQHEPVGAWVGDSIEWTENPYKFKHGQKLYTSPPASKPLTQDMVESCPYDGETLRGAFFDGWLKAEAAHGIKGDA